MEEDLAVPLTTHVNNNLRSIFSTVEVYMDCTHTSLTFPAISREPSLSTREFCIGQGMTKKDLWIRSRTLPCPKQFSQAE